MNGKLPNSLLLLVLRIVLVGSGLHSRLPKRPDALYPISSGATVLVMAAYTPYDVFVPDQVSLFLDSDQTSRLRGIEESRGTSPSISSIPGGDQDKPAWGIRQQAS